MSVKVLSRVWEYSKAKGSALLVMLAIADCCNDQSVAWPGIEYLAHHSRLSPRQVKRIIAGLEELGELQVYRERGRGNKYCLNVWGPKGADIRACFLCGQLEMSGKGWGIAIETHHLIPKKSGGTDEINNLVDLCQECHRRVHSKESPSTEELYYMVTGNSSVKMSPAASLGESPDVTRVVTSGVQSEDIAMSPDPSGSVNDPSIAAKNKIPTNPLDHIFQYHFRQEQKTTEMPKGWDGASEAEFEICQYVANQWRNGILPKRSQEIDRQIAGAAELLDMHDKDVRATKETISAYHDTEDGRDLWVSGPQSLTNVLPNFLARTKRDRPAIIKIGR